MEKLFKSTTICPVPWDELDEGLKAAHLDVLRRGIHYQCSSPPRDKILPSWILELQPEFSDVFFKGTKFYRFTIMVKKGHDD